MGILRQSNPLTRKFSELFYWGSIEDVNWRFTRISCRYKEMRVYCTRYKKTPPFAAIMCPFGPGRQNLSCEIWVRPRYDCKILLRCVMVCRNYWRKADFEQIYITLSYDAWQRTIKQSLICKLLPLSDLEWLWTFVTVIQNQTKN